jgi:hypothetical protein
LTSNRGVLLTTHAKLSLRRLPEKRLLLIVGSGLGRYRFFDHKILLYSAYFRIAGCEDQWRKYRYSGPFQHCNPNSKMTCLNSKGHNSVKNAGVGYTRSLTVAVLHQSALLGKEK